MDMELKFKVFQPPLIHLLFLHQI